MFVNTFYSFQSNDKFIKISNSLEEVCFNQDNTINRVIRAAVPYFNFYGPFNQIATPLGRILLAGENIKGAYVDLTAFVRQYRENTLDSSSYWKAGRGLVELAIVISTLAFYPLGMMLSTSLDLINEIQEFVQHTQTDTCTTADVALFLYRTLTHALRLGTILCAAPEMLVAFTAFQIFLEMGQAYQEYKQERYIEAVSKIGLALIRGYQVAPQIKQIYHKWTHQRAPMKLRAQAMPRLAQNAEEVERRAAIDVGSGGTKVLIADVDKKTNEIKQVVFEHSFSVPYQVSLEKSPDGTFDSFVQEQGLKTFQEIKLLLDQHEVQKVSAIATEAFRKANNGELFAREIRHLTQIPLQIISQQQEGVIAYQSALAIHKAEDKEAVVWDIGTGSFQITSQKGEQGYEVFTGGFGSVPFKNHIIEEIQGKDPSMIHSPNPISEEEYREIGRSARWFAKQASRELKAKINSLNTCILGIGRLFYNSVRPLAAAEGFTINRKGLRTFIRQSLNKSDQEMNNPFSHVDLPNCIQVLEVMKALHIHEITVVNTTTTKGIVIGPEKDFASWKKFIDD